MENYDYTSFGKTLWIFTFLASEKENQSKNATLIYGGLPKCCDSDVNKHKFGFINLLTAKSD